MLYYIRIDIFEWNDVDKTFVSKEFIIFYYWFFQIKELSFNKLCATAVMMYQWCLSILLMIFSAFKSAVVDVLESFYLSIKSESF